MSRLRNLFYLSSLIFSLLSLSSFTVADDAAVMSKLLAALSPAPSNWSTTTDCCNWKNVICDKKTGRVTSIKLAFRSLSGTLPSDLGTLTQLTYLSLQGNSFSGTIPSLSTLNSLQQLYLDNNNFTSIPTGFFQGLTSLQILTLSQNINLEPWTIPTELTQVTSLVVLDASNANIFGSLSAFTKLTWLRYLNLSDNNLSGSIPDGLAKLTSLQVLDVSNNNLVGSIPNFKSTVMLNTSGNAFLGTRSSGTSVPTVVLISVIVILVAVFLVLINCKRVWKDKNTGGVLEDKKTGRVSRDKHRVPGDKNTGGVPQNKNTGGVSGDKNTGGVPGDKNTGGVPGDKNTGGVPGDKNTGGVPEDKNTGGVPEDKNTGGVPGDKNTGGVPGDKNTGGVPGDKNTGGVPGEKNTGGVPGDKNTGGVPGDKNTGGVSKDKNTGGVPGNKNTGGVPEDKNTGGVPGDKNTGGVPKDKNTGEVPGNKNTGGVPEDKNTGGVPGDKNTGGVPKDKNTGGVPEDKNTGRVPENRNEVVGSNLVLLIEDLRQATNNFSEDNIVGSGGCGDVYKGELSDGTKIAVKKMKSGAMGVREMKQFDAEIAVLTKVRHKHLVALLGYCINDNERLLVFEYMPKGTLTQHLFNLGEKGCSLTWEQRIRIALDVARGVEYLHSLAQQIFIHRDLKPCNILLRDDMRAKVVDFGLVKHVPDGKHSVSTQWAGTFGYLAPECSETGKVTTKVDVYAFGVVLMQLITGREVIDKTNPDLYINQIPWFRKILINKNIRNAIDHTLNANEETMESIYKVAELAGHCIAPEPHRRPDMGHAVCILTPLVEQWKPTQHEEGQMQHTFSTFHEKEDTCGQMKSNE